MLTTGEYLKRVKKELHTVIVGSEKTRMELMKELGLSVNYLDAAWGRKNLKLRTLFQILEAVGEDPLVFFLRAFGQEADLEGLAVDPDVAAATERFHREFEDLEND
jgi:hypothetical protein